MAAQELVSAPVFIREGATSTLDVIPGKLGDRWLVSTLGCLYLAKGFFYRVVPADQGFESAGHLTDSSTGNVTSRDPDPKDSHRRLTLKYSKWTPA